MVEHSEGFSHGAASHMRCRWNPLSDALWEKGLRTLQLQLRVVLKTFYITLNQASNQIATSQFFATGRSDHAQGIQFGFLSANFSEPVGSYPR